MRRVVFFVILAFVGVFVFGCRSHRHRSDSSTVSDGQVQDPNSGDNSSDDGDEDKDKHENNGDNGKNNGKGHHKNSDKPGHRHHGDDESENK